MNKYFSSLRMHNNIMVWKRLYNMPQYSYSLYFMNLGIGVSTISVPIWIMIYIRLKVVSLLIDFLIIFLLYDIGVLMEESGEAVEFLIFGFRLQHYGPKQPKYMVNLIYN